MPNLTAPPEPIPIDVWRIKLGQLAEEDLPMARRTALLRLIWQESYLPRTALIVRVEAILVRGCFGEAQTAFEGDIAVIRQALAEAGYHLAYSRRPNWSGYYVKGRPLLDEGLQTLITGAVAEVDPDQIAISQKLTPAQHFRQGHSMTRLAEQVATYRLRQRQPHLSESAARQIVRKGDIKMTASGKSDLEFADFMRLVLEALEAARIDYLIGGAVAVWAWGEARTTRDFDLVIHVPPERIVTLSQELEKRDMLVPADIILDLLINPEGDLPINAIHLYTGYKAELFLLRSGDTYREIALARRRLVDLGPPLGEVYVHAPEDLILNKLHYFGLSHQPKHARDIASILSALGDDLDRDYIETWAARLGLTNLWVTVLGQV